MDTLDIMALSGHKTESNFLKYIKVTGRERAKRIAEHKFFQWLFASDFIAKFVIAYERDKFTILEIAFVWELAVFIITFMDTFFLAILVIAFL